MNCWCGVKGSPQELFNDSFLDATCGGSGTLYCYCGGDLCVCHNHGEQDCPGCPDCRQPEPGLDDFPESDYIPTWADEAHHGPKPTKETP